MVEKHCRLRIIFDCFIPQRLHPQQYNFALFTFSFQIKPFTLVQGCNATSNLGFRTCRISMGRFEFACITSNNPPLHIFV
jgi:hypothetical protein